MAGDEFDAEAVGDRWEELEGDQEDEDDVVPSVGQYLQLTPNTEGDYGFSDDETVHVGVNSQFTTEYTDIVVSVIADGDGSTTHVGGLTISLDDPARRDLISKLKGIDDAE